MKKVTLISGVLLGLMFLTGCTDQTKELEERIETENEIKLESEGQGEYNSRTQNIDKKDVEPGTRG